MSSRAAGELSPAVEVGPVRPTLAMGLLGRVGPRKIRTKIFLIFFVLILAVCVFFLLDSPRMMDRFMRGGAGQVVEAATGIIAEAVSGAAGNGDENLAGALARVCGRFEAVKYAVVEDADGNIIAAVNGESAARSFYKQTDGSSSTRGLRELFRKKVDLESDGAVVGSLYLGFSFPELAQKVGRERATVAGVTGAVFALGLLLAFVFSSVITRPLVQITRTAERVARGDLKQRARVFSRDEVGSLARAFNTMLEGMEKTYRDLEALNRSLEDRVSNRSVELEREISARIRMEKELRLVKQELEMRVSKRTEELSRANQELYGKIMETHRSRTQLEHTLEKLAKALEGTIDAMSLTIEMRDLYTAGHQRRVASLAVAIAEEMRLPSDKVEGLRMAGIIHDIGKIAMPAEILTKPARLTKTEFQLIKEHPRVGFDILKKIEFPWPVAQIILQHHERLDGTGYPDGLNGDAILAEARILAVADVVEALSSHRPYRPGLGMEKALEEIRRGRGIRYDLEVVDACLRLFKERRFSFKKEIDVALFQ